MNITRRQFLRSTAIAGASLALPVKFGVYSAQAAAYSPNLRKWIQPLRGLGPTGIPVAQGRPDPVFAGTTFF